MKNKECQINSLGHISDRVSAINFIWQRIKKLRRTFKRRRDYIINFFQELQGKKQTPPANQTIIQPGDIVRVKSKKDIQSTLNRWNKLNGCAFMEEMWPYCGTQQRVFKRVNKFLDERDYLMKKCNNIVLLEGIICTGTKDFGPCDRSCFFFWRDEWLEKIDADQQSTNWK